MQTPHCCSFCNTVSESRPGPAGPGRLGSGRARARAGHGAAVAGAAGGGEPALKFELWSIAPKV